jgi:hypothetical protein
LELPVGYHARTYRFRTLSLLSLELYQ